MQIAHNTVIHGDCLTVLRQMPDNCVDTIIADPPYGINFQSNWREKPKFSKIQNDKKPFVWWLYDAYRVLKNDGGGVLVFSKWNVQQVFIDVLDLAGFKVKNVIVWDKMAHGMGDLKATFAPQYETCIFATKGKFEFPGKRPKDVIRCMKVVSTQLKHPNEKPVELFKQLIECVTQPDDLILDPFAGTGAALVAAKELNRNFIGIEIDKEYYDIALKRIHSN